MSVINTNVNAIIAQNAGVKNSRMQTAAMQQLSTGSRINSAADDAAGLAISSKMTAQIRGLNQAVRNANDGISLIQTAEGALTEVNNMLQRMRELAVQSANDTNTSSDRTALNAEFVALRAEINRIGNNTQFNGMNVLDGQFTGNTDPGKFVFQVGANAAQTIDITLGDYRTTSDAAATHSVSHAGGLQSSVFTLTDDPTAGDLVTLNIGGTSIQFVSTGTAAADVTMLTGASDEAVAFQAAVTAALGTGTAFSGTGGDLTITGPANTSFAASGVNADGTTALAVATTSTALEDTITLSSSYEDGDIVSLSVGGTSFSYTVSGSMTGTEVAAAIVADSSGDLATWTAENAGFLDTVTNAGGTLVLTGNANVFYTTTASSVGSSAGDLGMINASDITTQSNSNSAVTAVDLAIGVVSGGRATMGATINRLNYAADNLLATSANVSASRSRIQDTDYSQATTELARTQIIQQASTAMLAQANQSAQSVLSLLK